MKISNEHLDILIEVINIGVGKAANILNQMVNEKIKLSVPSVKVLTLQEFYNSMPLHGSPFLSSVSLTFKSDFAGSCELIFSTEGASKLVTMFSDKDDLDEDEFNEMKQSTLAEIGNIVLNSLIGTISNLLSQKFIYTTPKYAEGTIQDLYKSSVYAKSTYILIAETNFEMVTSNISGNFLLIFETGSIDILFSKIELVNQSGNFKL